MAALDILAQYLATYHRHYTVTDVVRSRVPGYLHCTKPCPLAGRFWLCDDREHYHTIGIAGIGYPRRDERGRFTSPYRLWRELEGALPQESA